MASKQYIDQETGEIVTFSHEESFFSLRTTDNLSWALDLGATDFRMLLFLGTLMTKSGSIALNTINKRKLVKFLNIKQRAYYEALKRLTDRDLILRLESDSYLMNPDVCYKFRSNLYDHHKERYERLKLEQSDKNFDNKIRKESNNFNNKQKNG